MSHAVWLFSELNNSISTKQCIYSLDYEELMKQRLSQNRCRYIDILLQVIESEYMMMKWAYPVFISRERTLCFSGFYPRLLHSLVSLSDVLVYQRENNAGSSSTQLHYLL